MKFVYLLVVVFIAFEENMASTSTLTNLLVLFRHGLRTPVERFWTENIPCFGDEVDGELSRMGRSQMSFLGYFLRLRYNDYLGDTWNKTEVFYSNYQRNVDSARNVFDALFWNYNASLDRTTNFFQTPDNIDGVAIANGGNDSAFQGGLPNLNDYQDLINDINNSNGTSRKITSPVDLFLFSDQMITELGNKCQLPKWINQRMKNRLLDVYRNLFSSASRCDNVQLVQGSSDAMLSQIINLFNVSSSDNQFNTYLYSSHDLNLATLLTRMGMYNGIPTPFGAAIFFELHNISNNKIVRIFYDNTTEHSQLYQLGRPEGSLDLSYEDFARLSTVEYPCN